MNSESKHNATPVFDSGRRFQQFLAGMEPEHVRMLLEGATEREFIPGDVIFREGEPANRFYLVKSGEIALETTSAGTGPILIQTLSAGDALGWSWMFPPFAWHLRARVVQSARLICCDGARLLVLSEQNHDFGYQLMKRIAQVVIHRLQATRKRLIHEKSVLPSAAAVPT